jgi:hypothetical protein
MWRLALVLCLLPSSIVVAGETRGQLQVGLTITGPGKAAPVRPGAIASGNMRVSPVPLPRARPADIGPGDTAASSVGGTQMKQSQTIYDVERAGSSRKKIAPRERSQVKGGIVSGRDGSRIRDSRARNGCKNATVSDKYERCSDRLAFVALSKRLSGDGGPWNSGAAKRMVSLLISSHHLGDFG